MLEMRALGLAVLASVANVAALAEALLDRRALRHIIAERHERRKNYEALRMLTTGFARHEALRLVQPMIVLIIFIRRDLPFPHAMSAAVIVMMALMLINTVLDIRNRLALRRYVQTRPGGPGA